MTIAAGEAAFTFGNRRAVCRAKRPKPSWNPWRPCRTWRAYSSN